MGKKDLGSYDDPISGGRDKVDAAHSPTLREVDEAIFGKSEIPDSGRQTARPYPLDNITPDPTQPRREVPFTVRKRAKEDGVPEWEMWHQMAERLAGREIPLNSLLRGEGEAADTETTGQPLVDGFLSLVALAASINRDGLANAITVTAQGAGYVIETGERRYQAYRLLHGALDDAKFAKIPARVVDKSDVWRQAAENGSRKPLNAIGMARQLALLIMALNKGREGISYAPFDSFTGDSDREFYAQVANGVIHRIPKGISERILQATGLKSRTQIAQYRSLLSISDELWIQADEEDWTENRIREMVRPPSDMLTAVNISSPDPRIQSVHPRMSIKPGQGPGTMSDPKNHQILNGKETVEYINSETPVGGGLDVLIFHLDPQGRRTWAEVVRGHEVKDLPHPERGKPTGGINYDALPKPSYPSGPMLSVGQHRRNHQGKTFKILSVLNGLCSVVEISPSTGKPMSNAFSMHATAVSGMMLVEVLPEFDPEAARAAIMGPDEDDEETPLDTRLSGPDMPEGGWKPGMQIITFAGKKGTVLKTEGREVYIETGSDQRQWCFEGNMRLLTAREIEAEQTADNPLSTKPELPSWAVIGVEVEHSSGRRGPITDVKFAAGLNEWWISMDDPRRGGMTSGVSGFTPLNASPESDASIDEGAPPEWAARGKTVLHKPSNTICQIEGTAWDEPENQWYVRVNNGVGEWADLPVSECMPAVEEVVPPAPVERHPALHPQNASRVITERQYELEYLRAMAAEYKMTAEEDMILRMKVLTPNALDAFIRDKGEEGAYGELEAMWRACDAVKTRIMTRTEAAMNTVYNEAAEALRQKLIEKQAS